MRRLLSGLATVGVLVAGLLFAHHPMIVSGLRRIQTDPVDTRLLNYLLEHVSQWISGAPGHRSVWDPPIFYPARNILAYSDTLLSVAPIYWGWRRLGLPPDTAFPLWMLTASCLNFLAAFLLFRHGFRLGVLAANAGAFLFAFGAPRVNQLGHQQLLPHFFTILTVYALIRVFEGPDAPAWKRGFWWFALFFGLAAQLYAAFYLGWFLILALGLTVSWSLVFGASRRALVRVARRDGSLVLGAGVVAGLGLLPLARHYLAASREVGFRGFYEVSLSIPDWRSWVYMGPDSWFHAWIPRLDLFHGIALDHEHRIGVGLVTPLVCAIGLYQGRRRPGVGLVIVVAMSLFLSVTHLSRSLVADLGLLAVIAGAAALAIEPGDPRRVAILLGSLAVLVTALFSLPIVAPAALAFGTVAAGSELLRFRHRRAIRIACLAGFLLFACVVTYPSDARVWGLGAIVVPAGLIAIQRRGGTMSTVGFAWVAAVISIGLWAFLGDVFVWRLVHRHVYGSAAIRAVGRISLVLLIAAALGFALALERLRRGGWTAVACVVGMVCALEQGVTTPSYDKAVSRARSRAVAARVAPGSDAFFVSDEHESPNPWEPHLDAMWAGLDLGLPTINGYSGSSPPGWGPLADSSARDEPSADRVGAALTDWVRRHGLDLERITWIGGRPERFGLKPPRDVSRPAGP